MHSRLAFRKISSFFNQGYLPKSTLSTLGMQQADLFKTNECFQKTYKTYIFSQPKCGGTPQKLNNVQQNINGNTKSSIATH